MSKIIDFLKTHKKNVTLIKMAILSLLMMFAIKWTFLCEVLLALSVVFVLTEFDFDGFYLTFFLINFRFVFRNNLTGSIPYVIVVFACFAIQAIIKYWIIKKEKPKFNWWIIGLSLAFVIYLALPIHNIVLTAFIQVVIMILSLNFIFMFSSKIDIKSLILSFVYGCLAASVIYLLTQIIFDSYFIKLSYDVATYGMKRFRGLAGDPNAYTVDLVLSLAGLYFLYFKKKLKLVPYLVFTCILTTFSVLTYSKSSMLALVVLFVLICVSSYVTKFKQNWYKPLLVLLSICLAFVMTNVVFDMKTVTILDRFSSVFVFDTTQPETEQPQIPSTGETQQPSTGETQIPQQPSTGESQSPQQPSTGGSQDSQQPQQPSTGGELETPEENPTAPEQNVMDNIFTGRWTLWKNHLTFMFSSVDNFMFGGGVGNYIKPMECHNTAIQIFYETGFVGTVIFIALVVIMLMGMGFNLSLLKPSNWINWIMIITCCFLFMNVNYFGSTSFVFHVSLVVFALLYKENENEKLLVKDTDETKERETMENKKISVIVPIYKVEEFLDRCIQSLVNQNYKNLEIILVDDGSPDNCPKICDDWAKKDDRIKVIHKQNGGLSDARNAGIEMATGEFLTFVDSDDYVTEEFSKACVELMCNYDKNVYVFGNNVGSLKYDMFKNINVPICAHRKIFRTEFIKTNNIKFIKGIYHEDVPFILGIVGKTDKILNYDYNFYYYDTSSANSITREKNEDKYFKRFCDIYFGIDLVNEEQKILTDKNYVKFLSRTYYDSLRLARHIKNEEYQNKIVEILNKNKKYFKYPKRMFDMFIRLFWNVFGTKNMLKFLNKFSNFKNTKRD